MPTPIALLSSCISSDTPSPLSPPCSNVVQNAALLPPPLLSPPRYFYPLTASIPREYYHAHWDADIETTDDVVLVIYSQDISTGETTEFQYSDGVRRAAGVYPKVTMYPAATVGLAQNNARLRAVYSPPRVPDPYTRLATYPKRSRYFV